MKNTQYNVEDGRFLTPAEKRKFFGEQLSTGGFIFAPFKPLQVFAQIDIIGDGVALTWFRDRSKVYDGHIVAMFYKDEFIQDITDFEVKLIATCDANDARDVYYKVLDIIQEGGCL
jgi:hypothetical protein